jgi:uncharacterized protein
MDILQEAEAYARRALDGRESGHDFFHADRVRRNALALAAIEGGNPRVVELAALLHDVADPKLVPDPAAARAELEAFVRQGCGPAETGVAEHVLAIIAGMSFSSELKGVRADKSPEFQAVQDADRLDALGAIGIARCFAYGGSRNAPLYDPAIPPRTAMDEKTYRGGKSSSLNHFPEKLFLLKDRMNTATARKWAEERHAFLVEYYERFLKEWG